MVINDWQSFHDSLVIDTYGEPLPLPNPEQLDGFERKSGIRLPRTYREFLFVFGPGEFRSSLQIAAPDSSDAIDRFDLMRAHEGYRPTESELQYIRESDRPRAARLLYFGLIDGRDWLGWDLDDLRIPNDFEYGIYRRENHCVQFVAATFKELVEEHCERIFAPDPDWIEEDGGPQRVFHRALRN